MGQDAWPSRELLGSADVCVSSSPSVALFLVLHFSLLSKALCVTSPGLTSITFSATEGRCTTYSFSRSVLTTALVAPLCLKTLLSHELPFQYYTHSVVSWCVYILSHGYALEDARERSTLSKDTGFPFVLGYRMNGRTFFSTQGTPHFTQGNLWHKKLWWPSAGL